MITLVLNSSGDPTEERYAKLRARLADLEAEVTALFEEWRTQPTDGPLSYWSIYGMQRHLASVRQEIDVLVHGERNALKKAQSSLTKPSEVQAN